MKKIILFLFLGCILSCNTDKRNEVLVLGLIHGKHLTEPEFSTDVLRGFVRKIDPDIILAEIPPDRFEKAMTSFAETGVVNESRVARFPEYIDVIIPLTKEMDFKLIPTAAWTEEMANERLAKMRAIRDDPAREYEWQKYGLAKYIADSIKTSSGRQYDPFWINSSAYDDAGEIALTVYNDLFNDELGLGGWDNINKAHFANISRALDEHANQGKRVLITYGAGHKGWFLRELQKRDDIKLITLEEALGQ
ncbi:hypothetical protein [Ekhidna sp. To15]|uniref:hypothetical protein n=1 Tax=Ekhidna sp. To15 TaxID=3395267 RepID=UPI003F51FA8A